MATMYTEVQFPQAPSGGFTYEPTAPSGLVSFAPYIPSTATLKGAVVPPDWNPYSANAANRVQYLVDTNGTLTYNDVLLAINGIAGVQQQQINKLATQMKTQLDAGIPVTVDGKSYTLSLITSDLVSNIAKVMTANNIVATTATWVADTEYAANAMCMVGDTVLFTNAGGKSGTTAPVAPTEFQTPVTDGTVEWALMGLLINVINNRISWMTPQNVVSAFSQAMSSLTDIEAQFHGLITQIDAFSSDSPSGSAVAEIQAIAFPAS